MGILKGIRERNVGRNKRSTIVVNDNVSSMFTPGAGYEFATGIVKEYISEPEVFLQLPLLDEDNNKTGEILRDLLIPKDSEKIGLQRAKSILSNPEEAELMPRNSIIAYIIDDGFSSSGQKPFICYPFFPSHLSLPLKPGEHVWLIKEGTYGNIKYYWMTRKPGVKQTEDTNYTHVERLQEIDRMLEVQRSDEGLNKLILPSGLRDFATFKSTIPSNLPDGMNNNRISYESLAMTEEFTSEPVPSITKKCGDTVLQGSNNTLVHLTTEKFALSGRNSQNNFTGNLFEATIAGRQPLSPAIDLCVGRKRIDLENLKNSTLDIAEGSDISIIKTRRGEGYTRLESYEMNKVPELLDSPKIARSISEGYDFSATNCGARLYLSNDCAVDNVFGSSFDILSSLGGTAITTFADNNRVVADNSLRLVNRSGQSFIDMPSSGNVVIKSSIDNGQQFLSLINNGVSRLQARDKIELAVRSNNDPPDEAYVKLSVLKQIINVMEAQILACAPAAAAGSTAAAAATTFAAGGAVTPKALEQTADATAAAAVASAGSTPVDNLILTLGSTKIFGE